MRSSLLALAATLVLTGGVLATTEQTSVHVQTCEGWTAYAPLEDAPPDAVVDFLSVCSDGHDPPPEGWPPGAQPPAGRHPEIQIIR